MPALAHAYVFTGDCSVQEVVYHCLAELRLRKVFPGVNYANTNLFQNVSIKGGNKFPIRCYGRYIFKIGE